MLLTAWTIFKFIFLASALLLAVVMLFSLVHPLKFNLKLRASIKGQRGEFWFLHFFNAFKLGVVATRHTQDVIVKFLFFKYIIKRQQREKPIEKKPDAETKNVDKSLGDELEPIEPLESHDYTKTESEKQHIDGQNEAETVENPLDSEIPDSEGVKADEMTDSDSITKSEPAKVEVVETALDTPELGADIDTGTDKTEDEAEIVEEVKEAPVEIDSTPIKLPGEEELKTSKKKGTDEKDAEDEVIPFKAKLRNLKKMASRRYKEGKHWLRFGLKKWDMFKPIIFRFWEKLRKGFYLDGPDVRLRYALHEHYLTGMSQGSLSILSGMLQRFGVNFIPIPEFTNPMVYAKGNVTAVVRPWRLMFAAMSLVFELTLWKELWKLIKWYWNKRKAS